MLPDMELTASKTACAMSEHIRMSPDKIDEIQMAVVEACLNAFEHSEAPDRKVNIHFMVLGSDDDPEGIQITISDSGVGFSPDLIKRRREKAKENRPKAPQKRGYGLQIINGLMDEVDIMSSDDGTTVVMRKMR